MGQALYRTYRSKNFDELVGQEHITSTLKNGIKSGRLSHAYLFTGPRGVGKTSVARILAHQINDIPYNGEDTHLDIIEIDAASNRRIDEIRDLRDKVHLAPTSAKYKVYIIDEVHMLTREAFNALLKTLEEPPAHCIFILATTEAHKLPDTIISRTQRFNFKPVDVQTAAKHLATIAKAENITADKEALEIIARYGEGSFRDSIGLLDQLSSLNHKLTANVVRQHLGLPENEIVDGLIADIDEGKSSDILAKLDNLIIQAVEPNALAKSLAEKLRQRIAAGDLKISDLNLLKELVEVPASQKPEEMLELALLSASTSSTSITEPKTEQKDLKPAVHPKQVTPENKTPKTHKSEAKISAQFSGSFDLSMWEDVLAKVKDQAASLYTALRLSQPALKDGTLILNFEFDFHKKKVDQSKHKDIICSVIEASSGQKLNVVCRVDKMAARAAEKQLEQAGFYKPEVTTGDISAISNIFGGGEVLES